MWQPNFRESGKISAAVDIRMQKREKITESGQILPKFS